MIKGVTFQGALDTLADGGIPEEFILFLQAIHYGEVAMPDVEAVKRLIREVYPPASLYSEHYAPTWEGAMAAYRALHAERKPVKKATTKPAIRL